MPKVWVPKITFHKELNQDVWNGARLRPIVRQRLLLIAADFMDFLGFGEAEDVQFTGSMANFNWTRVSDIDLHPLIDFRLVDGDLELVKDTFGAKKSLWNDKHAITIKGYEVECYPQHIAEPHHSSGVYSLTRDEWIVVPDPTKPVIDITDVRDKAQDVGRMIDRALDDEDCGSECLDRIKEKIKRMRQTGLERGVEFSIENLAFKALRRSGHLERLWDEATERYDQEMSLE